MRLVTRAQSHTMNSKPNLSRDTIGNYTIPDTDPELVPRASVFMVSPGVHKGMPTSYLASLFNRVQEVCLTTERGNLAYDKVRGQTILQLPITDADRDAAPILRHEGASEVWLVLEPPNTNEETS